MKIKRIGVSFDFMKIMLAQDNVIPAARVISGLPADAVFCGAVIPDGKYLELTVQSKDFDDVKEGEVIPFHEITFETMQPARSAR